MDELIKKRRLEAEDENRVERVAQEGTTRMAFPAEILVCLEECASFPSALARLVTQFDDRRVVISSTNFSFATKLADGRVVTWGMASIGMVETAALCRLNCKVWTPGPGPGHD